MCDSAGARRGIGVSNPTGEGATGSFSNSCGSRVLELDRTCLSTQRRNRH